MLELKEIKKVYRIGDIETKALDGISVAFRKKEFVAILGTSGSGKTTCLNVIGGLDRYDSGDLIINGKSTKDFKPNEWDAYRNNTIGFVFQSYNLITHLSIVANVELGMTLSGVSNAEKHKKALEALEKVGLKDHLHKKPNQLSGGQMQRVAIARALANDPDILLCDEPTGALDTTTSVQIMDLIKEVAKDKLVIMVTHNPDIAEKYADRIVRFQDGKIVSDSKPHIEKPKKDEFKLKKTSMSFFTALKLSANNIRTKLGRTFLTAFASSIGIIGIALILSLSVGFQIQIDKYQRDALSEFPIMISKETASVDEDLMKQQSERMNGKNAEDKGVAYLYDNAMTQMTHENLINDKYMDYIKNVSPDFCKRIGYTRLIGFNILTKTDDGVKPFMASASSQTVSSYIGSYPVNVEENKENFISANFDILAGEVNDNETDVVLVLTSLNEFDKTLAKNLGFDTENIKEIKYEDIIGKKMRIVTNNDYYTKTEVNGSSSVFLPNTDYDALYDKANNIEITISAVVRPSEDAVISKMFEGLLYNEKLAERIMEDAKKSDIVKAQQGADHNIISMESFTKDSEKDMVLAYLGGSDIPFMITMYPTSFDQKDKLVEYLDAYNEDVSEEEKIIYTDMAETITSMTGGIMDGVTLVLIAFAGTSLIVSLIMICIITYTSVLERTKEIGVLRALGARKKDITRVFDAETFILGVCSGLLGVFIAWLLTFPINSVIYDKAELEHVATLKISHALMLVLVSTVLTMIGGHIPAKMAAKKDAVEALRTE